MVNGFNAVFSDKKKLSSWTDYLGMREVIVKANEQKLGRVTVGEWNKMENYQQIYVIAGTSMAYGMCMLVDLANDDKVRSDFCNGWKVPAKLYASEVDGLMGDSTQENKSIVVAFLRAEARFEGIADNSIRAGQMTRIADLIESYITQSNNPENAISGDCNTGEAWGIVCKSKSQLYYTEGFLEGVYSYTAQVKAGDTTNAFPFRVGQIVDELEKIIPNYDDNTKFLTVYLQANKNLIEMAKQK
jgi:hypothetical protein